MKKNSKKMVALLLALCLLIGGVVGGTIAYLVDKTDPVVNTFTTSDVDIDLTETTTDYKMVPGATIAKNPKVTVKAGSEACYVFVKVEKSANFGTYMTYDMAEGWNQLKNGDTNVDGVFYREVAADDEDQEFAVLKNNQVTVLTSVTKEKMETAKTANPTLTFTAYAIQMNHLAENSTPYGAWTLINQ